MNITLREGAGHAKTKLRTLPMLKFEEAKGKVVADTAPTQGGGYPYDEAVITAGAIAVLLQMCFSIAIAGLFATMQAGNFGPIPMFWLGACILAEFGMVTFLCHCVFLFPHSSPGKNMIAFGGLLVAALQLVVVSYGYAIGPLFAYVVAISITGWFMHRVFGASLSMRGEDVYQDALSTKVLLMLAPLLLVMGLVPTLVVMIIFGGGRMQPVFASSVITYSLVMLGLSITPILSIYAGFCFLRLRNGGKLVVATIVSAIALAIVVFEWITYSPQLYSLWVIAFISAYFLGLALAYLPFHWYGFRPVWAKRNASKRVEAPISFDDMS
jgi:hypothetical protein